MVRQSFIQHDLNALAQFTAFQSITFGRLGTLAVKIEGAAVRRRCWRSNLPRRLDPLGRCAHHLIKAGDFPHIDFRVFVDAVTSGYAPAIVEKFMKCFGGCIVQHGFGVATCQPRINRQQGLRSQSLFSSEKMNFHDQFDSQIGLEPKIYLRKQLLIK